MSLISETLSSYLPSRRRQTPSGWISFNAVCCQDTRGRGGLVINSNSATYHCFNCGFKASWQPGRTISQKMRKLLRLLNVPDDIISKISIDALRHLNEEKQSSTPTLPKFEQRTLPIGAVPIKRLIQTQPKELEPILDYIHGRGLSIEDYNFHWTPEEGFNNRLIIPYYYQHMIVGYTARRIDEGKPRYFADQQPGYVFNLDSQNEHRKYVIVCEGQIDAISIGAVSVNGSEINESQRLLINQLQRDVIIVPDRDKAGKKLIQNALKYNWFISFPNWEDNIKDINDAVRSYGKLNTLKMIIESIYTNEIKIKLKEKEWVKF
jgi:5S rRNA maturation endonuclease (ribonuclease M5)